MSESNVFFSEKAFLHIIEIHVSKLQKRCWPYRHFKNGTWVFFRLFMAGYDKVGALGGDDQ